MLSRSVLSRVPPCDVPIGERAVSAARGGWVRKLRLRFSLACDRLFRDDPDFDALLTQLVERTANPVTAAERAIAAALQSLAGQGNPAKPDPAGAANRAGSRGTDDLQLGSGSSGGYRSSLGGIEGGPEGPHSYVSLDLGYPLKAPVQNDA